MGTRVATHRGRRYIQTVAKRMSLDYGQTGYPAFHEESEDGQPVPCALGRPWVNKDTQETLTKMRIPRTDPRGKPLPGEPEDAKLAAKPR